MRYAIVFVPFLLFSCAVFNPPVPPEAFSIETALKLPFDGDVPLKEIDEFMGVKIGGFVAVGEVLFYGFKFEDPKGARKLFKSIVSKHIFKVKLVDLPWTGYFEFGKGVEKTVVWWRGVWLFAIEGKRKNVEKFKDSVFKVFSSLTD